jgi:hypothetical protein
VRIVEGEQRIEMPTDPCVIQKENPRSVIPFCPLELVLYFEK